MSCCKDLTPGARSTANTKLGRRAVLKGMIGAAAGLSLAGIGIAQGTRVRLAFCSQLLCVVPYEFTRASGFFAEEGLDVELVYTRGGNAAMQALVGGAVEYAATSFDVALQAFVNGAPIERFATTGRLPLFALATSPQAADAATEIAHLRGATVGVSALGNADHVLLLYLLERAGVDTEGVRYATLGPNLYDALRLGQIEAGMVQEPALSLLQEEGGRVLFNAMELADAEQVLGGPYEFMGVAVRSAEKEARLDEMRRLAHALEKGLLALQEASVSELVAALPDELVAGGDVQRLEDILARYRRSLYPDTVTIDPAASERVQASQLVAGVLEEPIDLERLLALDVLESVQP